MTTGGVSKQALLAWRQRIGLSSRAIRLRWRSATTACGRAGGRGRRRSDWPRLHIVVHSVEFKDY